MYLLVTDEHSNYINRMIKVKQLVTYQLGINVITIKYATCILIIKRQYHLLDMLEYRITKRIYFFFYLELKRKEGYELSLGSNLETRS